MTEWTAETIKEAYPYLYETHLHTSQGRRLRESRRGTDGAGL